MQPDNDKTWDGIIHDGQNEHARQKPPEQNPRNHLFILSLDPPIQNAFHATIPSSIKHLSGPIAQLKQPSTRDENPGDHIDHPHQQGQQTAPLMRDKQQDGLDVVLEEDAGDVDRVLGDRGRLAGGGVLVREDGVAGLAVDAGRVGGVALHGVAALGVDGGYDVEEVLVAVVVGVGGSDGFVERVQ